MMSSRIVHHIRGKIKDKKNERRGGHQSYKLGRRTKFESSLPNKTSRALIHLKTRQGHGRTAFRYQEGARIHSKSGNGDLQGGTVDPLSKSHTSKRNRRTARETGEADQKE